MLLKRTLLYLPAQLLAPLFQFIAAVVWTHWFAPAAYGTLTLIMATQELVFLVCLSWWSHYTMRHLESFGAGEARARFERAERRVLALSVLGQALLTLALLAGFGLALTPALVLASVAFMVTRSLAAHLADRARAEHRIGAYTHLQLWGSVGGFLLAHGLVVLVRPEPWLALAGFAVAQMIGLVIGWAMLRGGATASSGTRQMLREAARYGLPLLASGALAWASANGVRLIVEETVGLQALGLMAVGWGLGQRVISVVAMLLTAAAYPLALARLNAGDRDGAMEQIARNGALLFGLLAPAAAGMVAVAPVLTQLVVAPEYHAVTYAVLPVAVLYGAIRNLRVHYADQVFLLALASPQLLVINAIETVLTLAGAIVGVLLGGAVGACIGCLGGAIAGALVGFCWGALAHGLRFHWAPLAASAVAALLLAVGVSHLPVQATPAGLAAQVALGVAIYGAAMLLLAPSLARSIAGRLLPKLRPRRA
jgi:O-antigen/teichoic acid export membrane protein